MNELKNMNKLVRRWRARAEDCGPMAARAYLDAANDLESKIKRSVQLVVAVDGTGALTSNRLRQTAALQLNSDVRRSPMNDKLVAEYANGNGAAQVWKTWRDTMLSQGRGVDGKFMSWPIPSRDVSLDADIAFTVIDDFLTWAESYHGLRLTPVAVDGSGCSDPNDILATGTPIDYGATTLTPRHN